MNTFTLSLLALIPALLLCWYIYVKDRQEKEPLWLLAALFGAGALAYIPFLFAEDGLSRLTDLIFSPCMTYSLTGVPQFSSDAAFAGHTAVSALFTALAVELFKWVVLYFITFRSKHFGHLFDGLVYAVFVSLGFAALENIHFAISNGWDTLLLRSVTSVPAHMTYGVLMGFCYTLWNTYRLAAAHEKKLADGGLLEVTRPFRSALWLLFSVAGPILLHFFQLFATNLRNDVVSVLFYVVLAALYVLAFIGIHHLSKADDKNIEIAHRILMRKYPALSVSSAAPDKQ